MAGIKRETGPTGRRVAANLKRIRQQRGLSFAGLARSLAQLGQPVLDTGLLKIEKGERQVSADDLMALSVALGCSPAELLLPETIAPTAILAAHVQLTPGYATTLRRAWSWVTGEHPLADGSVQDEARFNAEARPHRFDLGSVAGTVPMDAHSAVTSAVVRSMAAGVTVDQIRTMVELSISAGLISGTVTPAGVA